MIAGHQGRCECIFLIPNWVANFNLLLGGIQLRGATTVTSQDILRGNAAAASAQDLRHAADMTLAIALQEEEGTETTDGIGLLAIVTLTAKTVTVMFDHVRRDHAAGTASSAKIASALAEETARKPRGVIAAEVPLGTEAERSGAERSLLHHTVREMTEIIQVIIIKMSGLLLGLSDNNQISAANF